MDAYTDADPVLKAVCAHWQTKLQHARAHKKKVFQDDADECASFYNGPRNWDELMGGHVGMTSMEILPDPTFKMRVNKAFELVTLFGPSLYYQNPVRTVTPRTPMEPPAQFFPDPYTAQAILSQQMQDTETDTLRGMVLEKYLNWLPVENNLEGESRLGIEQGLVIGRGCMWTELHTPPGTSFRVVQSCFDTTDNLLIDPDAVCPWDATWIARRCVHPTWQVERDYGLAPGTLKGDLESQSIQAAITQDPDSQWERKRGMTNDLLTYWKIYSKMGIGGRLSGINKRFRGALEMFGDYTYLVIAKDVPFPLNLPTAVQRQAQEDPQAAKQVLDRVAWPTPFWAHGGWPVALLDFHVVPDCPWPFSHLRAGLGELKFLNWAYSFLAGKMRNTCRDFIAVKKEAGEEILSTILEGRDLTILQLEADHKSIQELVSFLQHPEVNGDIWKVISAMEANFDKRVGLNELMYGDGGETQMRSAQEASIRNQNAGVRPDDMAKQVEAWMSAVAVNEAMCARYHLTGKDVFPVLGTLGASLWDQFVASQDLNDITRQLDYRIEAGSMKKPNKDTELANMNEGMQTLLPVFQAYGQVTGDMTPLNNLIADWAKARDINPARYQMQSMAPPAPVGPAAPGQEGPADAAAAQQQPAA